MKHRIFTLFILFSLIVSGCASKPTPDVEATVAAGIAATNAAQPTATPLPSATPTSRPKPTKTPEPTSTSTPEPETSIIDSTLDSGWTLYEVQDEGFAIALPPTWQQINLDPDTFRDNIAAYAELNPELTGMFSIEMLANLIASGMKFYALNPSTAALLLGSPATMNILKIDLGMEIPWDPYVQANVEQLEVISDPKYPLEHQEATLADTRAEEFKYVTGIASLAREPVLMRMVQYLLLDGNNAYVISLSCPYELSAEFMPEMEEIGYSFRLLD